MFKSRKSASHQVSPLAPPPLSPASTDVASFRQQQQQVGPPQAHRQGSGGGSGYFPPVERVQSQSSTSTKEKRRSGFFGLGGKKDKDKDKEQQREREQSDNRPRQSFSVDRPPSQNQQQPHRSIPGSYPGSSPGISNGQIQSRPVPDASGQGQFQPYAMRQFPPTEGGATIAFPEQQQRGVASPPPSGFVTPGSTSSMGSPSEPHPSSPVAGMPKSQSMGFNRSSMSQPPQVPDTHPYRGYINGQQEREQNRQGMSRSSSMPLDQHTGSNGGSGLPRNQPQPQDAAGRTRVTSGGSAKAPGTDLRAFDRIVELIGYQPQKTYVTSPPELEMILARTSAGGQPKQGQPGTPANDWDAVWLQLSGISLSMWSMKETRIAAAKGDKVPPTYFNITDSSLELLAPLPPPPHRPTSHPHHFVFSLNTAGSNRLLFSCPSERELARWATGLRLAAWERSRLEEIYTGHLIQAGGREPKSELVRGRMEGWVRVRVMGGTEWKRLWVVLSLPGSDETSKEEEKKGRRRSFFGMGEKEKDTAPVQEPNTGVAMATFYTEPRTAKNRTSVTPILTITNVTQTYAVFPERLEVMSQSNLLKVVGRVSGEMVTIEGRLRDSGWALLMPEAAGEAPVGEKPHPPTANQNGANVTPLSNMMKWVTGFHDVFKLYGRPERYNWDRRNPKSLLFAYPLEEEKQHLFLSIDEAMLSDCRTPHLAGIRAAFIGLVQRRLEGKLRPMNGPIEENEEDDEVEGRTQRPEGNYRLPPLSFGEAPGPNTSDQSVPRSLTPITERTDIASRTASTSTAKSQFTAIGVGSTGVAGDRKASGGSSKQGSQGSSKHGVQAGAGGEERLAPIADASTERFGQYTEEPEDSRMPQVTPTTAESKTAPTVWSQETGTTPTPQSGRTSPIRGQAFPKPFTAISTNGGRGPHPQQVAAQSPAYDSERDLPAVPSAGTSPTPPTPIALAPVLSPEPAVHAPTPRRVSSGDRPRTISGDLHQEPAAMYLMNMVEEEHQHSQRPNGGQQRQSLAPNNQSTSPSAMKKSPSPDRVRPTINTDLDSITKQPKPERKPSGARAPPPRRNSSSRALDPVKDSLTDEPEEIRLAEAPQSQAQEASHSRLPTSATQADLGEDVSAFMSFADNPSPVNSKGGPAPPVESSASQDDFRSSFAPSKAAAERRAKAEQAAADAERAKHLPGAGRRRGVAKEELTESESEEDDDEEGSPVQEKRLGQALPPLPVTGDQHRGQNAVPQRVTSTTRALPPVPRPPQVREPSGEYPAPNRDSYHSSRQPSFEQPRPRSRSPAGPHPMSMYSTGPGGNRQASQAQAAPPPPAARQTVWNANFSADHGMQQENRSGKFVELGEPQLTKAFAPHGLLQAGMQDKEDRSAKKQEEVARETGSSLINVPAKPPPPAAGLLGAVAAHEKERKNAGGIGATLTDREREKRLAEDRAREIEKLQRQQMEHMRQFGGDQYGQGQSQQGYNPYGVPPMSMGMNMGMMGMPQMGYPPYGGGFNPYAQQQAMMAAQMAYQQAMMSMSTAGSQAGDHYDPPQPPNQTPGMNGRSSSPAGSTRSQNFTPPQMHPFGGGGFYSPMMGSPMGVPPMGSPGPWGIMPPQPPMWGGASPAPGSPGSGGPMGTGPGQGQQRYDWLSPGQSNLNPGLSGPNSEGGDRRSRVSSAAGDRDEARRAESGYGAS